MRQLKYFGFKRLSDEIKKANNLRQSATRFDCTAHNGSYSGLLPFISKDMLFLYLLQKQDFKRSRPQWHLGGANSLNLTGLLPTESPYVFAGYTMNNPTLTNGKPNPLFGCRNDLLIIVAKDLQRQFEILVFEDGKPDMHNIVQDFIGGKYTAELRRLRATAQPFFDYKGVCYV